MSNMIDVRREKIRVLPFKPFNKLLERRLFSKVKEERLWKIP